LIDGFKEESQLESWLAGKVAGPTSDCLDILESP
jgi:hypothetical protein